MTNKIIKIDLNNVRVLYVKLEIVLSLIILDFSITTSHILYVKYSKSTLVLKIISYIYYFCGNDESDITVY